MIIDTDVLIWYMRGNEKAYEIIEKSNTFFISVVTYIELVQGMRNKKELNNLRKALHGWNAQILYISEEIPEPSERRKKRVVYASTPADIRQG